MNINDINYDLLKLEKNKNYAKLLYEAYGGLYGEISAIMQYTYENLIFIDKEIENKIRKISIEEMKHLNIIGKMLVKLGSKPVFINYNREYWKANKVKYDFKNLKNMITFNICIEEKSIKLYELLISKTNNKTIKEILEYIKKDEENHLNTFIKILETL